MKLSKFVLLVIPFISLPAFAVGLKVEQVYHDRSQLAVRADAESLEVGQELIVEFNGGTQCSISVLNVEKNLALAKYSNCPQAHLIKRGDKVEKPVFASQPVDKAHGKSADGNNDREDWYTYWGLGFASHSLNDSTSSSYGDGAEKSESLYADLFGFYWPSESYPGWIRGFVLDFDSVSVTRKPSGAVTASLTANQSLYGFSNMYFIREEIGSGFFLRADAGISLVDVSTFRTNLGDNNEKKYGVGILIGAGGSIPITRGTRALVMVTYKKTVATPYDIPTAGLSVGLLF